MRARAYSMVSKGMGKAARISKRNAKKAPQLGNRAKSTPIIHCDAGSARVSTKMLLTSTYIHSGVVFVCVTIPQKTATRRLKTSAVVTMTVTNGSYDAGVCIQTDCNHGTYTMTPQSNMSRRLGVDTATAISHSSGINASSQRIVACVMVGQTLN